MTPAETEQQTVWSSRVTIEPAAWSFSYTDYWGTVVTTFEVHEPHERLTVHAQGVVETRGDDLAWDVDRRVAPNDLGWPALQDRAVVDKMTEFLTVNERTQPPEELPDLAAATTGQPPRLAALDVCALIHDRSELRARLDEGHQYGQRGLGAGSRRLPGLQPRRARSPAFDRPARALRVGIPASGQR